MSLLVSDNRTNQRDYLGICLTILSLLLGGSIYLFFRGESLLLFRIIEWLKFSEELQQIRVILYPMQSLFPEWVIYSLPNALWVFSFSIYMALIESTKKFWLFAVWGASLSLELLQVVRLVPGTFSMIDLIMILIACAMSGLYIFLFQKKSFLL